MFSRTLRPVIRPFIIAAATVAASSVALGGQTGRAPSDVSSLTGTENVKAFIASRIQKNWTPPKTPWGDPDISGVFTTKDEANTPFERPDEWAGRSMDDITSKEFAEAIASRQAEALLRAPRVVPIHWFDSLAAANTRPWFVIDPPDGKMPPRQPGVSAPPSRARTEIIGIAGSLAADTLGGDRRPKDSYVDRGLGDRCIIFSAFGSLWPVPSNYGNSFQILQTRDYVVLRYEMVHEARMIALDGRPHTNGAARTYFGDSRGYWDGNTLVVDTRNIHEVMNYRSASARNLRMVERFTRTDPKHVEWTMTIDDPIVWTRPWTYSIPMTEDDTQLIFEYACHEGNYAMANLLTAGRLADKKQQKGR